MPDGEATDTAETTATTETASTGGASTGHDDVPPEQLPYLEPGAVDPGLGDRDEHGREKSRWVTYLQQMINYTYQQQEVMEHGYFDDQTANAVQRFRKEKNLPAGDYVDKELWLKLGAEDSYAKWEQAQANKTKRGQGTKQEGEQHGGDSTAASFDDVEWGVTLVSKTTDSSCWAAALAIVLNFREGSGWDVDTVCERGNTRAEEWTGTQRAEAVGAELGLRAVYCMAGSAAAWAEILGNYGPAWAPVPGQDYQSFVVGGVRTKDGHAEILVLDPEWGSDSWVAFTDFAQSYGFSEQSQVTVLC